MNKLNAFKFSLLTAGTMLALSPFAVHANNGMAGKLVTTGNDNIIHVRTSDEVVQGAKNFIENVSARGLNFLRNDGLSEEQRRKEFGSLLRDSFDLKTIGRFALGTYWRQANDAQKKEYLKLFEGMVINTYAKRFKEYQGQQVTVDRSRPEGEKDTIVNSRIVSNDGAPDVKLDWRVRYKNGEYRIIDVLVEGVSMSLTQRSEFASIIQRGGGNIEALLTKLRER